MHGIVLKKTILCIDLLVFEIIVRNSYNILNVVKPYTFLLSINVLTLSVLNSVGPTKIEEELLILLVRLLIIWHGTHSSESVKDLHNFPLILNTAVNAKHVSQPRK